MTKMTEELKPKQLERLEGKITETIEKVARLKERYDALATRNGALEEEVKTLRAANTELSEQITALGTRKNNGVEREQVLNRIDKMLEKFGELQI